MRCTKKTYRQRNMELKKMFRQSTRRQEREKRETQDKETIQKRKTKMADAISKASTIQQNINGLNTPTERQRLEEWMKSPTTCYLQETHFRYNDMGKLKIKRWKTYQTLIKGKQEWLYYYQIQETSEPRKLGEAEKGIT